MADLRHTSWRVWRRTRPFWGGLLLTAAGVELIGIPLSGVLSHGAVKLVIYIGIGGVFGVLIGVLLIACGVAVCLNPAHRVFYGIAGVLLGILSFPASNLGGFFVGMLLAIAGGSMAFAWTLADEPPDAAVPGAQGQRMLAVTALPAIMLASVLGAPGARAATAAPQGPAGAASCSSSACQARRPPRRPPHRARRRGRPPRRSHRQARRARAQQQGTRANAAPRSAALPPAAAWWPRPPRP